MAAVVEAPRRHSGRASGAEIGLERPNPNDRLVPLAGELVPAHEDLVEFGTGGTLRLTA